MPLTKKGKGGFSGVDLNEWVKKFKDNIDAVAAEQAKDVTEESNDASDEER